MGTELLLEAITRGKELCRISAECIEEEEWEEKYSKYLSGKSLELPDIDVLPELPIPDMTFGGLWKKEEAIKAEIEVGDVCRVLDPLYVYTSFEELAIETGHIDIVAEKYVTHENFEDTDEREVRVLIVKQNQYQPLRDMVAIVETIDSLVYLKFIINVKGLEMSYNNEKYIEKRRDSFLEEYVLGKPVSEAIPDECVDTLLIKLITRRNPMDMQFINPNLLTDEDYGRMLRQDGGLLGLIPEDRRSLELCQIAITNEDYSERFIPKDIKGLVLELAEVSYGKS